MALRTSRKGRRQKDLYRDLLKVAALTCGYIEQALQSGPPGPRTSLLLSELQALAEKMVRVI
ncbi:MAG TPA: hypothetical protein VLV83_23810, partial [Acidobacteriota bacterium]|nr:hypothetical protein [Acidobacteriota bacterium]